MIRTNTVSFFSALAAFLFATPIVVSAGSAIYELHKKVNNPWVGGQSHMVDESLISAVLSHKCHSGQTRFDQHAVTFWSSGWRQITFAATKLAANHFLR